MLEPLLLTCVQVATFQQSKALTNASGFFFAAGERLFLVTSRHVVYDKGTGHFPDRIEIEVHDNPDNLASSFIFSIPLYKDGLQNWRQGEDKGGEIDVAAIEINRTSLPDKALYYAFTPQHIKSNPDQMEIGTDLLIVGFPLGFHDTLHHLPIVRQAVNASSLRLRFQGNGFFLTDARTHRGMSGAPVVMRGIEANEKDTELRWTLLGIHSARIDIGTRDIKLDEALGVNCAWFADILLTLVED